MCLKVKKKAIGFLYLPYSNQLNEKFFQFFEEPKFFDSTRARTFGLGSACVRYTAMAKKFYQPWRIRRSTRLC